MSISLHGSVQAASTPTPVGSPVTATAPADGTSDVGTEVKAEISADGMLQAAMNAVQDNLLKLSNPATWQATKAKSSQPDVLQVTSDARASVGTVKVRIQQLAQDQVSSTGEFSSLGTAVALEVLHIQSGAWNTPPSFFSMNPNWPKSSVRMDPNDNSMARVRDRINSASVGVVATVVADATGTRLILRSTGTGNSAGFQTTAQMSDGSVATESPAPVDPSTMAALGGWAGMEVTQVAQNAKLEVNEQPMESESNVVFDLAPGVHGQLKQASSTPVSVDISRDIEPAAQAIEGLADGLSRLSSLLSEADATSPMTQQAQSLYDSTRTTLTQALQAPDETDAPVEVDGETLRRQLQEAPQTLAEAFQPASAPQLGNTPATLPPLPPASDNGAAANDAVTPASDSSVKARQRWLSSYVELGQNADQPALVLSGS